MSILDGVGKERKSRVCRQTLSNILHHPLIESSKAYRIKECREQENRRFNIKGRKESPTEQSQSWPILILIQNPLLYSTTATAEIIKIHVDYQQRLQDW